MDVEDDCIMEDGTLVPIRVRGRKEILDTYYDYFVNHFGDSKDTFAGYINEIEKNQKKQKIII